ncbi:MAG: acyltransferase [Phycisphaeraceae bacterium]|nr:acyltransferase [Phycisphaeraceae bacterium]
MSHGWFKLAAQCAGGVRAWPWHLRGLVVRRLLGPEQAMADISERASLVPGRLGIYARQALYRRWLKHLGQDVHIGFLTLLSKPEASIGDRVYIGRFCVIGRVTIGDDVMLADGAQALSGRYHHGRTHEPGSTLRDNPVQCGAITIGRGAWIGAGAIIMADVGDHAIVGAGAVVVQPVPAGATVGGVPARPLRLSANSAEAA